MLSNRVIGIIGGIGPESSATFYYDLIKSIQNNFNIKSTADYPKIIINNLAVADLIEENISSDDIMPILKGLKELDKYGPDFNVIICNTVYGYYYYLKKNTETEILNLLDIVGKYIEYNKIVDVGIVGTNMTVSSLYNYHGIRTHIVSKEKQLAINKMIKNFNKGEINDAGKIELEVIINELIGQGAEKVLLACTELGLIGKGIKNTIDPMVILKEEIIERLKQLDATSKNTF